MNIHNTFAEEFAALLDKAYPEFGLAPAPDREEFEQRRCFSFEVPCKSPEVKAPLVVSVREGEITMEWLGARERFTTGPEAMTWLRRFIQELVVVDTWYSGAEVHSRHFMEVRQSSPPFARMRVVRRSWYGTCDTEIDPAA